MAITLGPNKGAASALRGLSRASTEISSLTERLSTGLRINRASDDAAGLAVASSLNVESRILSQGIRNLNDGASFLNIAEGALKQLSEIATRQLELAEQAANGTYSTKQRQALTTEANALVDEYNRIVETTSFNGVRAFRTSDQALTLQGGSGAQGALQVNIGSALGRAVGSGQFSVVTSSALQVVGIATGDLNNDGIGDLVYAESGIGATSLIVKLVQANGQKTTTQYALSEESAYSVVIADFNNDGVADLSYAGSNLGGSVYVRLGNGNGSFGNEISVGGSGTSTSSIVVADFNGDGAKDIFYQAEDSYLALGNGNGTFQSFTGSYGFIGAEADMETFDYNGDGFQDLIVGNLQTQQIEIWMGGTTPFAERRTIVSGVDAQAFTTGDFNGDGYFDFGYAAPTGIYALLGNANGSFKVNQVSTNGTAYSLKGADINGDGKMDLVVGANLNVQTFFGNGNGSFKQVSSYASHAQFRDALAVGDINGDGIYDIVSGSYGGFTHLDFYYGTPTTSFSENYFNLNSAASAREGITTARAVLDRVSGELGNIGSAQSRIGISISSLQSRKQTVDEAHSRIVSADIASTAAELVRQQILRQSAASVLAHSNKDFEIALTLLGNN